MENLQIRQYGFKCFMFTLTLSLSILSRFVWGSGLRSVAREGWQMLGSAWSQQHQASQTSPLGRKKDTAQLGSTSGDPGPSVGTKFITGIV